MTDLEKSLSKLVRNFSITDDRESEKLDAIVTLASRFARKIHKDVGGDRREVMSIMLDQCSGEIAEKVKLRWKDSLRLIREYESEGISSCKKRSLKRTLKNRGFL